MHETVGLGSESWCKRNQRLSNNFELLYYTQVFVIYICQKVVEEMSSFLDHLLSDCSKFTLPPFTISDLYNSIGKDELFTYSKILFYKYYNYIYIYLFPISPSGLTCSL